MLNVKRKRRLLICIVLYYYEILANLIGNIKDIQMDFLF